MKPRTIAGGFARYSLGAFAAALMLVAVQLAFDGVCCCLQSERDE